MPALVLCMTMSLDGFFAGPNGELDWMTQVPDPEFRHDNVSFFDRFDRGFIGYPAAAGMIPYWQAMAGNPDAPADERALAEAINKLHPFIVSSKEEEIPWDNAELLLAQTDNELAGAVRAQKATTGKDLGVPGGIRTARTFVRLGLIDEYVLTVHPVTIGNGQRVFTGKVKLTPAGAKTYPSGVVRATYRPAR